MTPEERAVYVKRLCSLSNPDAADHQKRLMRSLEFLTSMKSETIWIPVDTLRELEAYIWILHNELENERVWPAIVEKLPSPLAFAQ